MRCLLICPYREQAGGAELSLLHLLEHGRKEGVDWSLACLEDGPILEAAMDWGIPGCSLGLPRLGSVRLGLGLARLVRFARAQQADLILGWMPHVGYLACAAASLTGARASWFQKGGATGVLSGWRRFAVTRRVDALLANSVSTGFSQLRQTVDLPVLVAPSGVDLSRFDVGRLGSAAACREALGLPPDGRMLVMVGRLQRWKGFHTLVEAMPRLLERDDQTTAVIVGGAHAGEAEYQPELKAIAKRFGVSDRVVFAGAVDHATVPRYMQAADVVVHASHHEPFGIVIVEALALGKPLVASRVGGPGWTVRDGGEGLLIDPENPAALAAAVERFSSDPDLVSRVAVSGPIRAAEFSVEVFVNRVSAAVRSIVLGQTLEPAVYLDGERQVEPDLPTVQTGGAARSL